MKGSWGGLSTKQAKPSFSGYRSEEGPRTLAGKLQAAVKAFPVEDKWLLFLGRRSKGA